MANHVDPFAGKPLIQIAASYNANLSPWPRPVGLTRFNRNLPPVLPLHSKLFGGPQENALHRDATLQDSQAPEGVLIRAGRR